MEEEYLTLKEACRRIKYAEQTMYNLNSTKRLIRGVHYIKPLGGKLLYKWSALKSWLEETGDGEAIGSAAQTEDRPDLGVAGQEPRMMPNCRINI
jgi:hypothetical protein